MGIVSENAAGIGITAIPTPLIDIAWDGWMVHEQGQLMAQSTALSEGGGTQSQRVKIDSKAMRKFRATDTLVAVLQVTETGDGTSMNASLKSRMLVKLP